MKKIRIRSSVAFCYVGLYLSLIASVIHVEAQQAKKVPRIGYLHGGSKLDRTDEAVRQGLRLLGYIVGDNIVIEYRHADGKLERFPDLAADLVRTNVDIIVAVSEAGTRAVGMLQKQFRSSW